MILQELDKELEPYNLLHHQFYKAWSAGSLSIETLQFYATQYYHHVAEFPQYLTWLLAICKDPKHRQILLANLADEALGPDNHPELWLRFAEGLGVSRETVVGAQPGAFTQTLIDGYNELATSYASGLGSLYAYERQVPAVAKSKIAGLEKFYNISDERSLEFFREHITADEWHSQECADLILSLSPEEQQEAREGAIAGAKLLWHFLDGMPMDECSMAVTTA